MKKILIALAIATVYASSINAENTTNQNLSTRMTKLELSLESSPQLPNSQFSISSDFLQVQDVQYPDWVFNPNKYKTETTLAFTGASKMYTDPQSAQKDAIKDGARQMSEYINNHVTSYTKDKTFTDSQTDQPISSQVVAAEISEFLTSEMLRGARAEKIFFANKKTQAGKPYVEGFVLYVADIKSIAPIMNKYEVQSNEVAGDSIKNDAGAPQNNAQNDMGNTDNRFDNSTADSNTDFSAGQSNPSGKSNGTSANNSDAKSMLEGMERDMSGRLQNYDDKKKAIQSQSVAQNKPQSKPQNPAPAPIPTPPASEPSPSLSDDENPLGL